MGKFSLFISAISLLVLALVISTGLVMRDNMVNIYDNLEQSMGDEMFMFNSVSGKVPIPAIRGEVLGILLDEVVKKNALVRRPVMAFLLFSDYNMLSKKAKTLVNMRRCIDSAENTYYLYKKALRTESSFALASPKGVEYPQIKDKAQFISYLKSAVGGQNTLFSGKLKLDENDEDTFLQRAAYIYCIEYLK